MMKEGEIMPHIHGLNKTTLLDYPGRVAATVFLGGCNFRCPFCQNSSLVLHPSEEPEISEEEVLRFLKKRTGILEGVCISGGEPTLSADLEDFIVKIREMGYPVKLDTNGTQPEVLKDLAEKESYVIVGRCVNYVFKDRPNTLRVFIHAPWEFRVEQASQKISGSREDVEKFLLKDDKRKQDYYRKFAGGQWSDATNYDLCLNSGKLGFDKCVDAIETQLKIMFGK